MDFSVMILAAGAGTRMRSSKPKVLHRLCGKPMIFYIVREALAVSGDVHIVLYHQKDIIQSYLQECLKEGELQGNLTFHTQNHQHFPGTCGAFFASEIGQDFASEDASEGKSGGKNAGKEAIKADKTHAKDSKKIIDFAYPRVVVLNGDTPLITKQSIENLAKSISQSHSKHSTKNVTKITISTMKLENPQGYGRIIFEGKSINAIVEEKDCTQEQKLLNVVNAGIYAFDREILREFCPKISNENAQKEFYLTDVIALARKSGVHIGAFEGDIDEFMGVNTKNELAKAEEKKLEILRNEAMKNGVIMHLPSSIYIEEGVEFEGECELENGVAIKGKCLIKDSLIKSHTVVESSKIISSDIGPFAHIRPKSVIDSTHIGNFVETKAADLRGVKAGHLSYLGDCEIGRGSNVGAGVITCNYDGKAKHKTRVGENVFIGSDTQLVAPVNVESSVLIAAGSTITNDIKSGDLAISRTKQVNKAGFFKKFFGDK